MNRCRAIAPLLAATAVVCAASIARAEDASPTSRTGVDASAPSDGVGSAGEVAPRDADVEPGDSAHPGDAVVERDAATTTAQEPTDAGGPAPILSDGIRVIGASATVVTGAASDAGAASRLTGRTSVRPRNTRRAAPEETTGVVIKTILGLAVLLLVAYAGAHPRVKRIEEALGISQVITAGFPFVALGLIARLPGIGILTDDVLAELNPLLLFGLGWIGFQEGCEFDVRTLDRLPSGTAVVIVLTTSVPFVVIATVSALLMFQLGEPVSDGTFLRDAICLGAAGAMTAPRIVRAVAPKALSDSIGGGTDIVAQVTQLDDIAGIVALAFLAAYFRPAGHEFTWQIPQLAWLFVALGLGATVGIVIYAMLRRPLSDPEFLAVVLGSVAFAAGMAGYLRLSPVVVGFVAGALVGNFPFDQKAMLRDMLGRLERPVYLLFLMVAGALWNIGDWRGWIFVPVFVVARFVGRGVARIASRRAASPLPADLEEATSVVAPLSVLAIAIVVSAQSLYRGRAIHWMVTAVIAGAIVTEILVQLSIRVFPPKAQQKSNGNGPPPAPRAPGDVTKPADP